MKTSCMQILSPVFFGLLTSLILVPNTSARVFVTTNSTWRYFKGTSEASDPTNAWRELDYDDSAWLVNAAPFHYGTNAVGGDDDLTDDDFRIDVELAETPPTFTFSTAAYTVREDATQVVVQVMRGGALDGGATVDYATTNGSAVAGSDYEKVAGTLIFEEGQTEQTFRVRIFKDALIEDTEDLQLRLSNPGGGAALSSPSTATVQITEWQTPPVPHHFSSITLGPDQTATLGLDGSALRMFNLSGTISNQFKEMFDLYVVEASTNLADWTRLAMLLRTNNCPNPLRFQDTNAASFDRRFYRTLTNHLITGFPKPTGPFAVGTISRILTDSSRSNRYGLSTNSSFLSTFWYPAEPPRAGSLPGPYTDRAVAGDRTFYNWWGWPLAWTNVLPQCVAHAVPA